MTRYLCDFEVFGRVQGVFFRKYTKQQANQLKLTGWCRNTEKNTVKGELEGEADNINKMKIWLEKTGSPYSQVTNATFSTLKPLEKPLHDSFVIRK